MHSKTLKNQFWFKIISPDGSYGVTLESLDCSTRTAEYLSVTLFDAKGNPTSDSSGVAGRNHLIPGSNGDFIADVICGQLS
jgi:hypothetical protein